MNIILNVNVCNISLIDPYGDIISYIFILLYWSYAIFMLYNFQLQVKYK